MAVRHYRVSVKHSLLAFVHLYVYRVEVTVRIRCLKACSYTPTDTEFLRQCELIKRGIKKYWEVDLFNVDGKYGSIHFNSNVCLKIVTIDNGFARTRSHTHGCKVSSKLK